MGVCFNCYIILDCCKEQGWSRPFLLVLEIIVTDFGSEVSVHAAHGGQIVESSA